MASEPTLLHDREADIIALVAEIGTAGIAAARRLIGSDDPRDLADAIHALCAIHGGHPGLLDVVRGRDDPGAEAWIRQAAAGFAIERANLARLVAAVGPSPSTPGQAQTEAAIAALRRALDTLGHSDRPGCASGAAIAFVLDWHSVRPLIDDAATRLGVETLECALPTTAPATAATATVARARRFGAQQWLAQQSALWDLLDARARARSAP